MGAWTPSSKEEAWKKQADSRHVLLRLSSSLIISECPKCELLHGLHHLWVTHFVLNFSNVIFHRTLIMMNLGKCSFNV